MLLSLAKKLSKLCCWLEDGGFDERILNFDELLIVDAGASFILLLIVDIDVGEFNFDNACFGNKFSVVLLVGFAEILLLIPNLFTVSLFFFRKLFLIKFVFCCWFWFSADVVVVVVVVVDPGFLNTNLRKNL